MIIKTLSPSLSVSDALTTEDVSALADKGIKTIICNRPDNEEPQQCSFHVLSVQATKYGIETFHLPVVGGQITHLQVKKMNELLLNCTSPILAYCRSGNRSTTLWALGKVIKGEAVEPIVQKALDIGFDIAPAMLKGKEWLGNSD